MKIQEICVEGKMMKGFCRAILIFLVLIFGCKPHPSGEDVIQKKERAISKLSKNDTTHYSVTDAMGEHGLIGLSVAVIEDYKIVWKDSWGIKEAGTDEEIDENTAFSTASISKPITATLFAILEEKGQIDLKAPVSGYLKRWKLPDSEFLKDTVLTLEHLLSHTAGTTQGGFADFYEGDTIPTIVHSLKGQIPGYDKEIDFVSVPGTKWKYSGGGYVIAQMALEDHLGKSLAHLAEEYLFLPLGLKNTTMRQPNEVGFLNNVAKAHDENGKTIRTGIPITPQVSASGLWSTPTDMAFFLIEMQNALRNEGNRVISHDVAQRVTTIVTSKVMGGWSLGWERRYGFGNYEWFSHGGANTGIGGHIFATMDGGNGIAIFGNGPNGIRIPVLVKFRGSIIKAHGWYLPMDRESEQEVPHDFIIWATGKYRDVQFDLEVEIISKDKKMRMAPSFSGEKYSELIYIGDSTFLMDEFPNKIKFEKNPSDSLVYIVLMRNGTNEKEYTLQKRE
ncbi:serine hydrolase domain-containing protein [Ulvibacterium sp.]|uniref:serine hydrolase domain-containing protein n=1 Tax=Ulvibacterium sp. TaxID=2665914 RepID=UPI003BA84AB7